MQLNSTYQDKSSEFWALLKFTSSKLGYSERKSKNNPDPGLKKHSLEEILKISKQVNLEDSIAKDVKDYIDYRADALENNVKNALMDRTEAKKVFEQLTNKHPNTTCDLPLNKQKGKKKHPAYFNCIINILTEVNLGNTKFDESPRKFTTITDDNNRLVKTLSRRIDGAYPSLNDPLAIWEIKEYYGTTTFVSRVADGVYETQLDGHELRQAEKLVNHDIKHYLFVDDYFTWWDKGRSYLCRLVDAMHEGLVDEVIFGKEVLIRWPKIVKSWPSPS